MNPSLQKKKKKKERKKERKRREKNRKVLLISERLSNCESRFARDAQLRPEITGSTIHHVSREMHICYETVSLPGLDVIRVRDRNKDLRLVDLVSRASSSSGIANTLPSPEGERNGDDDWQAASIGLPDSSTSTFSSSSFSSFRLSLFLSLGLAIDMRRDLERDRENRSSAKYREIGRFPLLTQFPHGFRWPITQTPRRRRGA